MIDIELTPPAKWIVLINQLPQLQLGGRNRIIYNYKLIYVKKESFPYNGNIFNKTHIHLCQTIHTYKLVHKYFDNSFGDFSTFNESDIFRTLSQHMNIVFKFIHRDYNNNSNNK